MDPDRRVELDCRLFLDCIVQLLPPFVLTTGRLRTSGAPERHRRSNEYVLTEGGKVETQPAVTSSDESNPKYHLHRFMAGPLLLTGC